MKKYLTLLLLCLSAIVEVNAQCTPVDCRPGVTLPTYGGVCSETLPQGTVNQEVDEEVSIVIGGSCFNTTEIDPTINLGTVWIQDVFGFGFTGLPAGIIVTPNQTSYTAAGSDAIGCVGVTGTPTEAGIFSAGITFTVRVRTFPFGCGNFFLSLTPTLPFDFALDLTVLPDASFSGLDASYCQVDDAVALTATGTQGGTFSGLGVVGTTFDPGLAGPGTHVIVYAVSAQEGAATAPATNTSSQTVVVLPSTLYYVDSDMDGYGDPNNTIEVCGPQPPETSDNNEDCDDTNEFINPDADEVCDGEDNDCDGDVDGDDDELLFAICQDISVQLDITGIALLPASSVDDGSSDACGTASLSVSPSGFTCNEIGANTVTLTLQANGITSSCTATVTVQDPLGACLDPCDPDLEPPVASCINLTVQLGPSGETSIPRTDFLSGTDNCGMAPITGSVLFNCGSFAAGTFSANFGVFDLTGNQGTCVVTFTVEDPLGTCVDPCDPDLDDPTASCQNITVQLDAGGSASILPADIDNGSNDGCGIAGLALDLSSFNCANAGANTVTLTVTDFGGNTATCSATVTIEDVTSPIALCQDITIQLDANGMASITAADVDGGSSDACGVTLSISPASYDCGDLGSNTATLGVFDPIFNTDNCTANVEVVDVTDPQVTCTADISVNTDPGQCSADVTIAPPAILDNCDNSFPPFKLDGLSEPGTFITDVILGAFDQILIDAPDGATIVDINVRVDASHTWVSDIDIGFLNPAFSGILLLSRPVNCSNDNLLITFDDEATMTASQLDNWCMNTDPWFTGEAKPLNALSTYDGQDPSGLWTLYVQDFAPNDFGTLNAWSLVVVYSDPGGRMSTQTYTRDLKAERTTEPDLSVGASIDYEDKLLAQRNAPGNFAITTLVNDYNGTADASDNYPLGTTTVTWTAIDESGNSAQCSQTVTVTDNEVPTITCPPNLTVNTDPGQCSIVGVDLGTPSTSDNCGVASISNDAGPHLPIVVTQIEWTVSDNAGNTAMCTQGITILDNEAPNANCQNITIELDPAGEALLTPQDIDNGSTDACGINQLFLEGEQPFLIFECPEANATIPIELIALDLTGNVGTCTALVTIEDPLGACIDPCDPDITPPSAVCQDITVQLDAAGSATVLPVDIDNGSFDFCGPATLDGISLIGGLIDPLLAYVCSDVGPNTVVLHVSDGSGNPATCTSTVVVEDNVAPNAVCQNITVQLDANGTATSLPADVNGGSSDACGLIGEGIDDFTGSWICADVGVNTVTLTVTDANGNASSCSALVTVEDNVAPNAVCQNITVQLDANGTATTLPADVNGGSSDACGLIGEGIDDFTGSWICADVGVNTVTLTVTDANGNASSCSALVTVEDNVAPNAVCQNITVQLDGNGETTVLPAQIDGGSSDACPFTVEIEGVNAGHFTCPSVGQNTLSLLVADGSGNSATCTAIVMVEDNDPPTITCPIDLTVDTDPGECGAVVSFILDSEDFCPKVVDQIGGLPSGVLYPVGLTTNSFTVTDNSGNSASCSFNVTVEDNDPPTITCPIDLTVDTDPGECGAVVSFILDSEDFCPKVVDQTGGLPSGVLYPVGLTTNSFTVTDNSGNSASCSFNVTVEDNDPPTITCPIDLTVNTDPGECGAVVSFILDSEDFCPEVVDQIGGLPSGVLYPVGLTTNSFTVTDNSGNSASCSFNVTVEDNDPPTITCPIDLTVNTDPGECGAVVSFILDSEDFCPKVVDQIGGLPSGVLYPVGLTTNSFTVTDNSGNSASCSFNVTVEDNEAPTALCQDLTVELDPGGQAELTPLELDFGSVDFCDIGEFSFEGPGPTLEFGCLDAGSTIPIELFVLDLSGNTGTCISQVTIEDPLGACINPCDPDLDPPTAICQDLTVQLDASGEACISAGDVDDGSSDLCGDVVLFLPDATPCRLFECAELGANTVTLTATDNNGNSSTCTATVSVEDNVAPSALCQDITVQLDGNGETTVLHSQIDGGSSDACPFVVEIEGINAGHFTCPSVGQNTLSLLVTDGSGNSSSCVAVVTVQDITPPVALCQDITVQLDVNGEATITPQDVDNGSSDACGIASLTLDVSDLEQGVGDCTDVGPHTSLLTVTDNNGNSSTCTSTIDIQDNIPPVALCQDITVQLDANGEATITAQDVDNGSSDACGIASLTFDVDDIEQGAAGCTDVGLHTALLTVTDNNGNSSTCNSTIDVQDNVAPIAICQDITVQLDASGSNSVSVIDLDNGSFDVCGITIKTFPSGGIAELVFCEDMPSVSFTVTVTDESGNESTCTSNVAIQDNIPPTAICQDITVQLDENGEGSADIADFDLGSFDNCPGILPRVGWEMGLITCADIGTTPQTLTVEDASGNESTATCNVTVEDNISPVALCQDITVELDDIGEATVVSTDLNGGTSDNCEFEIVADQWDFICTDANTTIPIELVALDLSGNEGSCISMITVEDPLGACIDPCDPDVEPPVATCINLTIQLGPSGETSIPRTDFLSGIDNCEMAPITGSVLFNCGSFAAGTFSSAFGVFDQSGNQGTCVVTFTVEDPLGTCVDPCDPDETPPTALCQDITVELDELGIVTIIPDDIDNGSSDVCGPVNLFLLEDQSFLLFECFDVGAPIPIELVALDLSGNDATCTSLITITDPLGACIEPCIPNPTCLDVTIQLDNNGSAQVDPVGLYGGGDEFPCSAIGFQSDKDILNCTEVGDVPYVLTVEYSDGNFGTCTGIISVQDNIAPIALCQDITVELDVNGNASITEEDIDNGSNDPCGLKENVIVGHIFTCEEIGANTATLIVTDNSDNVSTCTSLVTVEDNIPPTAICQDITVQLDENCEGSVTAQELDGGSSDACGIDFVQINVPGEDPVIQIGYLIHDLGNDVQILGVIDVNGNESTCTSNITIVDVIAPTAICNDLTVELDGNGQATVPASDATTASSDNCGDITSFWDDSDLLFGFTCSDIGVFSAILTIEDASGNSSICTSVITVLDIIPAIVICQDITVFLDELGTASITPEDLDAGSSDECGILDILIDGDPGPVDFTCNDIGIHFFEVGADVSAGSSGSVICSVTIDGSLSQCEGCLDTNSPPIAVCNNVTVELDNTGNIFIDDIIIGLISAGSSDNCEIISSTAQPDAFSCSDVGPNPLILTITDNDNLSSSCTAIIDVVDVTPPIAICQDITVQLDENGEVIVAATEVGGGSSDACGVGLSFIDNHIKPLFCSDQDIAIAFVIAVDASSNSSTCTATITVEDNLPPTAICQDITVQVDENCEACFTVDDLNAGSSDNCSFTMFLPNGTATRCVLNLNLNSHSTGLVITDPSGNTSSCTSIVTIQDNIPPIAICQDISVPLDENGLASIHPEDIDNGSSDNCSAYILEVDEDGKFCSDIGDNPVQLTITDVSGNSSTCTSIVSVEDNLPPIAICQNITVQIDENGTIDLIPEDLDDGSTDNCGINVYGDDHGLDACTDIGSNPVVLTVTDASGNSSSCTSIVTIEDNIPPTAICQDITVQLDANGEASSSPADLDNGSFDNCVYQHNQTNLDFWNCSHIGPNPVTFSIEDPSGNTASCTGNVWIIDVTPAIAICQDVTVELDINGEATVTAEDFDNGTTDNCQTYSRLLVNFGSMHCIDIGTIPVQVIFTDGSGNTSSCSPNLTVTDPLGACSDPCDPDNTPPIAICNDLTVFLDAGGQAIVLPEEVTLNSFDNCGPVFPFYDDNGHGTHICDNIGTTSYPVFVEDNSGNTSSCITNITVLDNLPPTISCPTNIEINDACGPQTVNFTSLPDDNCGGLGVVFFSNAVVVESGDLFPMGTTAITAIATDDAGNESSCSFNITLRDLVPPIAICQDITVQLDVQGSGSVSANDLNNGSNDACGIGSLVPAFPFPFTCDNLGANIVVLTVTDVNGNSSSCNSTVTVEDNLSPIAICNDLTVSLGPNGAAAVPATDATTASSDNCGDITSVWWVGGDLMFELNCGDLGVFTAIITVEDGCGNSSNCNSTISVVDVTPPIAICNDITVELNPNGTTIVPASDATTSSSDNCGDITSFWDASADIFVLFTCADIGTIPASLTVEDGSGNSSTCTAFVTVEDTSPPAISVVCITHPCPSLVITASADEIDCGAQVAVEALGLDNCEITQMSFEITFEDLSVTASTTVNTGITANEFFPVGNHSICFSAQDGQGNTSTSCITVIVIDDTPPVAECQDATVQLDANGNASIDVDDVIVNYTDCIPYDPYLETSDFTCIALGTKGKKVLAEDDVTGEVFELCSFNITVEDPLNVCDVPECAVPENLSATIITFNKAMLGWDPVPNAVRYQVEVKFNFWPFVIRRKIVTNNAWRFAGIPFLTYEFRVRADCDELGWSDFSDWFEFTLNPFAFTDGNPSASINNDPDFGDLFKTEINFSAFPNPTTGILNIQNLGTELNGAEVMIIDLSGRYVHYEIMDWLPGEQREIDLGELDNGMYMINLVNDGIPIWTEKVFLSK